MPCAVSVIAILVCVVFCSNSEKFARSRRLADDEYDQEYRYHRESVASGLYGYLNSTISFVAKLSEIAVVAGSKTSSAKNDTLQIFLKSAINQTTGEFRNMQKAVQNISSKCLQFVNHKSAIFDGWEDPVPASSQSSLEAVLNEMNLPGFDAFVVWFQQQFPLLEAELDRKTYSLSMEAFESLKTAKSHWYELHLTLHNVTGSDWRRFKAEYDNYINHFGDVYVMYGWLVFTERLWRMVELTASVASSVVGLQLNYVSTLSHFTTQGKDGLGWKQDQALISMREQNSRVVLQLQLPLLDLVEKSDAVQQNSKVFEKWG